jgi:hypothetical protein
MVIHTPSPIALDRMSEAGMAMGEVKFQSVQRAKISWPTFFKEATKVVVWRQHAAIYNVTHDHIR